MSGSINFDPNKIISTDTLSLNKDQEGALKLDQRRSIVKVLVGTGITLGVLALIIGGIALSKAHAASAAAAAGDGVNVTGLGSLGTSGSIVVMGMGAVLNVGSFIYYRKKKREENAALLIVKQQGMGEMQQSLGLDKYAVVQDPVSGLVFILTSKSKSVLTDKSHITPEVLKLAQVDKTMTQMGPPEEAS